MENQMNYRNERRAQWCKNKFVQAGQHHLLQDADACLVEAVRVQENLLPEVEVGETAIRTIEGVLPWRVNKRVHRR